MSSNKIIKRKIAIGGKARIPPKAVPERIVADEKRYLMNTYERPPIVFTHGRGCRLYDSQGHEYLDFLGGIAVNALGHAHPRMVRVIRREAARAIHVSNLYRHRYQGLLARKLAELSGLDRVFFTNSGTEAIDAALKLARGYAHAKGGKGAYEAAGSPKSNILALENSFHGRTFGALSITDNAKYRNPFAPLVPGVKFVRFNDVNDLEAKFDSSVCAIVLETIQGEGGVYPVSAEFWQSARALATRHDAALIADEIQCGLGRTGRYFAYQKFDAAPDIVAIAKPLAGGLPLGALLANDNFAGAFVPGLHGTTFGGGPLVCAAALEFLAVVEEAKLLANIRERSAELRMGIEKIAAHYPFIREIRGEGLMLGIDLSQEGAPFVREALRSGLLMNCTHGNVLRLLPPFIIRRRDVAEFLARFEAVVSRVSKMKAQAKPGNAQAKTPAVALAATA